MTKDILASLLLLFLTCTLSPGAPGEKEEAPPPRDPSSTTSFVVFPQDCNANPPMLFGGKLLSEMDRLAGITARRALYASPLGVRDAVTLSITDMTFHKGARVKDHLVLSSRLVSISAKTLTIKIAVHRELPPPTPPELIADATFTFCAFDLTTSKAVPHGLPPSPGGALRQDK